MLWSSRICGLDSFFLPLFTEVPRRSLRSPRRLATLQAPFALLTTSMEDLGGSWGRQVVYAPLRGSPRHPIETQRVSEGLRAP
jgi:hypothetical protein